jgi:hypothetical protein
MLVCWLGLLLCQDLHSHICIVIQGLLYQMFVQNCVEGTLPACAPFQGAPSARSVGCLVRVDLLVFCMPMCRGKILTLS